MRVRTMYAIGTTAVAAALAVGAGAGVGTGHWAVAADGCLAVMAVLAAAWAMLYGVGSAWQSSSLGRAVLAQAIIMAAVLAQGAVSQWVSTDYPGRHEIRFTMYALGAVAYATMLRSLWREQRRGG